MSHHNRMRIIKRAFFVIAVVSIGFASFAFFFLVQMKIWILTPNFYRENILTKSV